MFTIKNIDEIIHQLTEPWKPVEVIRVNDQIIRIALFKGEYHWHKHNEEDELFFVLRGSITIQISDEKELTVNEGEMLVVPKGTAHKPSSLQESYVLLFEPQTIRSQGD